MRIKLCVSIIFVAFVCFNVIFFKQEIQIENPKKDVAYIFIELTPPQLFSMYPSSTQIVMFCLFHGIPYKIINREAVTQYHKYPFIEFNGMHIHGFADVEKILKHHFNIKPHEREKEIIKVTEAVNTELDYLIHRVRTRDVKFTEAVFRSLPDNNLLKQEFYKAMILVYENIQLNKPSLDEQKEENYRISQYLHAIQDHIDGKRYMFGNEITTADIAVYSQLVSIHHIHPESIVSTFLREEFPSVLDYLKRIRNRARNLRKKYVL